MKIRSGFVSNSSSCSFSIMRNALSTAQYDCLRNHIECAKAFNFDNDNYASYNKSDSWHIELTDDLIKCDTIIDNFDLHAFVLEVLNVPEDAIIDYDHS